MKSKSFVKQECMKAITMKDAKSSTRRCGVDKSETSVSLCTAATYLCSILFEGRGECTRYIPILRSKRLKHHTLWGDRYIYG